MSTERIRICIADDNEGFTNNFAKILSENPNFYVVAACNNGKELIEKIKEEETDIVITDIIMPKLDGIGVMEQIDKEYELGNIKKRPGIIIISAITHDNFKFDIFSKGINYYMVKPVNYKMLEERIIELHRGIQNSEVTSRIGSQLREIGIYPNLVGYRYMRTAIQMLVEQPEKYFDYRNELYSVIATNHNTNARTVEKAIINAVNTSWHREKDKMIEVLKINETNKKPSANIVLTLIAKDIEEKI